MSGIGTVVGLGCNLVGGLRVGPDRLTGSYIRDRETKCERYLFNGRCVGGSVMRSANVCGLKGRR